MFKGRARTILVDVFLMGHPQYEEMRRRCVTIDDTAGDKLSFISCLCAADCVCPITMSNAR
jgi:hypothetical protein